MTKAETARQYRLREGNDMPTRKLARIMYTENNLLFKNEEDARNYLGKIEGKRGGKGNRVTPIENARTEPRPLNPYKLPESDEIEYTPFVISGFKRIGIFSDIHVPYHNISALEAAITFCKKDKIDALLLNGDILDCYQLSRFIKDPNKRNFAEELKSFQQLIEVFNREFKCKIYFKYGNHCERYENFLFQKAKELIGVEEFKLENIIKARAEGIEIIKDKRIIQLGGLNVIHGHEFVQSIFNPVNVARGLFLRGKTSALQGHSHQTSEHTESNMNGKLTTTWSAGCLCELNPAFMPLNKWNHGFCIVDIEGETFDVRNKRIHKGKVL
jgi:predicted phosphodiesterase